MDKTYILYEVVLLAPYHDGPLDCQAGALDWLWLSTVRYRFGFALVRLTVTGVTGLALRLMFFGCGY